MWDSDDSPSFNELLLCTFVRFAVFVTKQEIFEKGESNYFFSSQISKTSSQNCVVFASKVSHKKLF